MWKTFLANVCKNTTPSEWIPPIWRLNAIACMYDMFYSHSSAFSKHIYVCYNILMKVFHSHLFLVWAVIVAGWLAGWLAFNHTHSQASKMLFRRSNTLNKETREWKKKLQENSTQREKQSESTWLKPSSVLYTHHYHSYVPVSYVNLCLHRPH